ncbi:SusE domain-containing protein [Cellulophaga lytica]|uniref:SusE domain-containing protein n=1 Tax=Cellulophaga lytica TaxID=979 RepID=UPI0026E456D1|nr:SusE domain-containing protein [Cellulophaga lytica]MDO6855108.1 SusE domain-containing protein [Cellulophaga lytica]
MMKIILKNIWILCLSLALFTSCDDDSDLAQISSTASTGVANFSTTTLVLDKDDKEADALTINFNEPELGVASGKSYQLLFDLVGGDFSGAEIKSIEENTTVTFKTEEVNQILINLGAEPGVAAEIQVKVETILSSDTSMFSDVSTLSITPYAAELDLSSKWGLVGSATTNGWDGPDMPFYQTTDKSLDAGTFVAYVTLADGEIKIRADNAWDTNYGGSDGVLEADGSNIVVTAGTYKIVFNENDLTYSIENYSWGVVGSATTNGWDGPDMPFTYNPLFDNWVAEVTLVDGEIKIRKNNDWTVNFGDLELDGILDTEADNNIAVTAGDYSITFNPVTLEYSIK